MDGWVDTLCLSSPSSPPSYFVFQLPLKAPASVFLLFELPQMRAPPAAAATQLQILQFELESFRPWIYRHRDLQISDNPPPLKSRFVLCAADRRQPPTPTLLSQKGGFLLGCGCCSHNDLEWFFFSLMMMGWIWEHDRRNGAFPCFPHQSLGGVHFYHVQLF